MSDLSALYTTRYNVALQDVAGQLQTFLDDIFSEVNHVNRITTRPKSIDSFLQKAAREDSNGNLKYDDPLHQIQDQVGALIVTRFLSEVAEVEAVVDRFFRRIERVHHTPESEFEFGYEGRHFILFLPIDITSLHDDQICPEFFELQVKTLFQHAWSETNHAIGYKRANDLTAEQRRLTAFVAAQAWGADRAIDELSRDIDQVTEKKDA